MTDLVNALEKIEFGNVRNNGCGAGRTMFAVDIDGTLYPCHRFVGKENSHWVIFGQDQTTVNSSR